VQILICNAWLSALRNSVRRTWGVVRGVCKTLAACWFGSCDNPLGMVQVSRMVLLVVALLSVEVASAGDIFDVESLDTGPLDEREPQRLIDVQPERTPSPVIDGWPATRSEYPAAGGILRDAHVYKSFFEQTDIRSFLCSSTLIAPDVVLAAAHCLDQQVPGFDEWEFSEIVYHWTRQADLSNYTAYPPEELPADVVTVSQWVNHPNWNGTMNMAGGMWENSDIALLFLEEAVLDVPYAALATADEAELIVEGLPIEMVGWGLQEQETGESPKTKMQGTSHIAQVSSWELLLGDGDGESMKCFGDSGGPSFADLKGVKPYQPTRLIGVTSHASGSSECADYGAIDTRVDYFRNWIEGEMRVRCQDGTRVWCDVEGIPDPPLIEEEGAAQACGCSSHSAGAWSFTSWMGLLLVLLTRRRRLHR